MVSAAQLGTRNGLTNAVTRNLDWSYAFEPSIAITTGRIDKLGLDIRSFREPLHKAISLVMTKSIRANFDAGGRPAHWDALAASTMSRRGYEGYSNADPLVKSGKLRRVAGQINIWTISSTSATIRDLPQSVWYGKVHQAGLHQGGAGKGAKTGGFSAFIAKGGARQLAKSRSARLVDIPQREFFIIQPQDRQAIIEIFEKWLDERVLKAMGPSL